MENPQISNYGFLAMIPKNPGTYIKVCIIISVSKFMMKSSPFSDEGQ